MHKLLNSLASFMLIALCVSIFSNVIPTQAAFGVSPPWVRNNLLLPGATLEEVIYLSRDTTDSAMQAVVRITGDDELLKWINIQNEADLIMRVGQNILPMTVVVEVPEDAELRDYNGGIFVTLAPVEDDNTLEGGQVAIALGAHISVELSVIGDEITGYEVKSASVEAQEENTAFSVNVKVENTGNTDISDVEGQIMVYDRASDKVVKTLAFMPLDEPVSFNETKKVEMVYEDFKPESGEYWVEVKATKDGETTYEDRLLQKVSAEIVPVITPEGVPRDNIYLMLGLAGLGLALVAIIGILVVLILKKRAKNNL